MNFVSSRFMRFIAMLLGVTLLAGCFAEQVKVDPTGTVVMVSFAVAPKGVDGVVTTKTIECNLREQATPEKAKQYEADPRLLVKENACLEFDDGKKYRLAQLAVQGSPQAAGEFAKAGITAASGGLFNFIVQKALQDNQAAICREQGGCGGPQIINQNFNVANGGQGGRGGSGGAAVSGSQSGAATVVDVSVQGSAGGCTDGTCK